MLPQIVPAGVEGLSLCGSKAACVHGASSRPLSFLPSSRPHVLREPAAEGVGRLPKERLAGRLARQAPLGSAEVAAESAHGGATSVWGARLKRAKQEILLGALQHALIGDGAEALPSARRTDSVGSTAAAFDPSSAPYAEAACSMQVQVELAAPAVSARKPSPGVNSATRRREIMDRSVHEKENNPRLFLLRADSPSSEGKSGHVLQTHGRQDAGGGAHRRAKGSTSEGAAGAQRAQKDVLLPKPHPRLATKRRLTSCPELSESPKPSTKLAVPGYRPSGPSMMSNLCKIRLANTLPAGRAGSSTSDSDCAANVDNALSVASTVVTVTRRARSADDPPCPGTGASVGMAVGESGHMTHDELRPARESQKEPVDLAALQQKARDRIAARKKKERQQLEQWEEEQERAKRERLEAKQGANAEAAQRRAAVYALNYLMRQQEWGAWLDFQKEQGLEGCSRPSSKRSRPSSKSKRAGSAAKSRPASSAKAATTSVACSAAATSDPPDAVGA